MGRLFWDLIEQRAIASPDKVMMVDECDRAMTFGAYRDACVAVAAGLRAQGVEPSSVVAWQLPTSMEAVVTMGALGRIGAVQAPIVPILREREVTFIASQLRATHLVVPGVWRNFDYPAMAASVSTRVGCTVIVSDQSGDRCTDNIFGLTLPTADPTAVALPDQSSLPDRDDIQWVFYTSGTTADPKGAKHTDHTAIATSTHLLSGLKLGADDVTPITSPISHVGGVMTLATQLMTAFQIILVRQFDAAATPMLAARHDMTVLRGAVPVIRAFVGAQRANGSAPLYPRLRGVQCGGASRPIDVHQDVRAVFGLHGATSSYGMTECPGVTACDPDDTEAHIAASSGIITPGSDIVVAAAAGTRCAPGVEGELMVRGVQLFKGYVDASLDANAFDEHGYFHSGDLGTIDAEGYVKVTGRIKDIIIRNAENISALEIEDVLISHPSIADVAVIGLPDARTGERCCAVVQLVAGVATITVTDVRVHCENNEIAKQKIPEQVEIVSEIPRNAMGKIEKQKLRQQFAPVVTP